ncbi:MAG: DUF547 domain-containing protein [Alphaproteobacteria bacterium]|nr:DUF547 domain-containing protein [Alphaproteobacteria bacterium]
MALVRAFLAAVLLALLPSAAGAIESWFAPSAKLWPRWEAHDPAATRAIDHGPWQRFLSTHVSQGADGIARVAYGKVGAEDRAALDAYIRALVAEPVGRLSRAEQRAYWINLYNAATVRLILERYPVASIRDINISPGLFSSGPWGRTLVTVEGEALSLNDIEHRILRPIWKDPRIHYALNCASLGCPDLQTEAFTAANAEALLDRAAVAFVNHPRGARVDGGRLRVSSIYEWFQEDFGGSEAGVIAHLRRYAAGPLAQALAGVRGIDSHAYDWALNDAR